jgi:large subunit ribosomal protein L6
MSRIGKRPIPVPAGVKVEVDDKNLVTVKGPKGTLQQQVDPEVKIEQQGQELVLTIADDRLMGAKHGLYRALLHNMVVGVTDGFTKTLEMVGTGYRAAAEENGKKLNIAIGFSHPVILTAPENITFETPVQTKIVVHGINKQQVGNLAADIRAIRKPEPYLGKGIKYEGEVIRRKEGKAGKK